MLGAKTITVSVEQLECKHDWDLDILRCKKCKIAQEIWDSVAYTRLAKAFKPKNENSGKKTY